MNDPRVELLLRYFFSRIDMVAFYASWEKPQPTPGNSLLPSLLDGHIRGDKAPSVEVTYTNQKGTGKNKGRFRIGSYTPNADSFTKWLCIDFDSGPGHANGLIDPKAAILLAYEKAKSLNVPSNLECSGGGKGWHLWVFFDPMVPAKQARQLGLLLCPQDARCENGEMADARSNRGIEVFPKQPKIKHNGFGNLIWLPWWNHAQPGGNQFYHLGDSNNFVLYLPESFDTVSPDHVTQTLLTHVPSSPESAGTRQNIRTTLPGHVPKTTSTEWDEWRAQALAKLPLEQIYGEYLTGKQSGTEWLECRDPNSLSGDQNPSAGVATGMGTFERGSFHSFLSGETISVFDFLLRHSRATDFSTARNLIAELSGVPLFKEPLPPKASGRLPEIVVNNRQLVDVIGDAWQVLVRNNTPPQLYHRGDQIARVRINALEDKANLQLLSEEELYSILIRVARWVRANDGGVINTAPTHEISRDMVREIDMRLPWLDTIVQTPVFSSRGKLITTPGYHPTERLFVHLPVALQEITIPDCPSSAEVEAAKTLLFDELLIDFPFVSDSDRAHVIAAMILPFVRPLIPDCTPLHLIESPTPGSGKGLLFKVISLVVTGTIVSGRTLPENEDELRKAITTELLNGEPLILLDNIDDRRALHSVNLAAVLTMPVWSDRQLGAQKKIIVPNNALWLMTGNNLKLALDMVRRIVRCRIVPHDEQPWTRNGFKHSLPGWAKQNRRNIVIALLTLIQCWVANGMPNSSKTIGSFEEWSKVVGGILETAGVVGFLDNLQDQYEAATQDQAMWREFVLAWWEEYHERAVKISDLAQFCESKELLTPLRSEGTTRAHQIKLGIALSRMTDRTIAGYRILHATDGVNQSRYKFYYLLPESSDPATTSYQNSQISLPVDQTDLDHQSVSENAENLNTERDTDDELPF